MKNIFTFLVFIFLYSNVFSQGDTYYYWYKSDKYALQLNPKKEFLLLKDGVDKNILSDSLRVEKDKIENIKRVELGTSLIPYRMQDAEKDNGYWTVVSGKENALNFSSQIILYHSPFFYSNSGKELGLSHLFYVKLYKQEDVTLLEDLAENNRVKILGNNKFMPLWYTLSCSRDSKGNAMEMANLFYETGFFISAQPDLMEDDLIQTVNDSFFVDQWNLKNTGQYDGTAGNDIQIEDAWKITKSNSGAIIAILDQGLEMDHPDLPNIYSISYDTESGTSPSQVLGNHGTAVAGIAGAGTNNNIGIAGIAPSGQLMSISNSLEGTPNSRIARADGINFAWQNGASVINNSWSSSVQYEVIDDAIDNAITLGRDELGTIVTFCTQNNNNNFITYPSSLLDVIAVGAVSMCEERKSLTSCDGEVWGSNYGTGLDVVAPGVYIYTTDRQGGGGYNNASGTDGNYYDRFNGTSAATPHVSAIAALVLSINSNLTVQQVRNAIEGTCEKIGNYTYSLGAGEQSGLTWNNEMGYGRVNAYKTLKYTIENYGALLGVGMSQVTLPLWENMTMKANVNLENNSTLTIEANNLVTISAYSGTVTLGGTGGLSKFASGDLKENRGSNKTLETSKTIPDAFQLSQNYPNPFNPTTVINYSLPVAEKVVIKIYDVLGREIAGLVNEFKQAGEYSVTFDASNLSSGVYFYRINAGKFSQTKKLILAK